MYQSISIIGNLGRDPELKYLSDGTGVATFSIATNRKYKKDGEQKSDVAWFRVSVFGAQAEACSTYLRKGSLALVEGRLNSDPTTGGPRIYNKQDGTPAASYEIVSNKVVFLSGDKKEAPSQAQPEVF